ncbi:tetratricopeptide repeat protein [Methanobacterium alcaliphilum]|uniref:tetratricopeptide repeat protein n=1 Tax=Methanobacterium alcaliphilum TaxID=392018 RepID=UPI00200AAF0E|nr:tetratricopeptide repeat protein [Methanobacterium alcaliphilum]MCK9150401.1 tetratricopeptide repeat protein [Methanobacterium alcaliphilum]
MTNKDTEMYYNQAMAFLGQGETEKSLEFFDKALTFDKDYTPAWNNKGIVFLDKGDYEQALYCFEQVIKLNPKDHMVLYNKGYVLLMLNRFQESVDVMGLFLKKYSLKDDFYKYALFLQAQGFYNLQEYMQAKILLERVIKIDKNFKEASDLLDQLLKKIK